MEMVGGVWCVAVVVEAVIVPAFNIQRPHACFAAVQLQRCERWTRWTRLGEVGLTFSRMSARDKDETPSWLPLEDNGTGGTNAGLQL